MIYNINDKNSKYIAANLIKNGEIIVYPTDTIYGFGVDASNSQAIEKLNQLKNRGNPYSIIVETINMLKSYADISNNLEEHIKQFVPGPYTFILNKKYNKNLSDFISLNLKTIGIRIPDHIFPINIVALTKIPIVTTSVNVHKSKSINTAKEIINKFQDINIFYDEKIDQKSLGSTIIDLTKNSPKILRQGDGAYIS